MLKLGPRRSQPSIVFKPTPLRREEPTLELQEPQPAPGAMDLLLDASQALHQVLRQRGIHLERESHKEVLELLVQRSIRAHEPPAAEDAAQTLSFWILRDMENANVPESSPHETPQITLNVANILLNDVST